MIDDGKSMKIAGDKCPVATIAFICVEISDSGIKPVKSSGTSCFKSHM
jgi:hypothetical protein